MGDVQETIDTVEQAVSKADLSIGKLVYALIVLAVGIVIIRFLMMGINRLLNRSRLDYSIKKVLRGAIHFLFGFVLTIIVLGYLNIEVSSLVALLSVAVFAVSLALQDLLSNIAAGLLLLSTRPFTIGDFIEADSVMGTVTETGVFYTKLNTIDNKVIQIPNSELSKGKIINFSAEKTRRVDIKFTASYDAPFEAVKACILGVISSHPKTLDDPAPMVRVNNFGESSIEYIVRVWCPNADYWDVYFDVVEGVKTAFDRDGIEMTYNHLNVHMIAPKNNT